MSLFPQFGHSSSAPPSGKSGLGGSKKFTTPLSSIMECMNWKLQLSHFRVHRGIPSPVRLSGWVAFRWSYTKKVRLTVAIREPNLADGHVARRDGSNPQTSGRPLQKNLVLGLPSNLLGYMQKEFLVVFAQFRKQLTKLREITSVAAHTAPLFATLGLFQSANGCRRLAFVE